MNTLAPRARALTEAGLLVYLLLIPAGLAAPAWSREAALAMMLAGVLVAAVFARSTPAFELVLPLALFAGSTALSVVFSAYPDRSLARAAYAPVAWLVFVA